jgi:hypothetical protein
MTLRLSAVATFHLNEFDLVAATVFSAIVKARDARCPGDAAARDAEETILPLGDTWNYSIFSYNILRTYLRNLSDCD